MPAGNDAVFTGNVTDGGDVAWSTEYDSSRRSTAGAPVTLSCTFDATTNPVTAAANLVTAYKQKAQAKGLTQSACSSGATVTFLPTDVDVTGMTVGSGNSPVSTNPNAPTPVGNTGLNVYEKSS